MDGWHGKAAPLLRIPVPTPAAIVGELRVTRTIVVVPFHFSRYFAAELYPEIKWWKGAKTLIFSTSLLGN
jgi:hypothetical protein